MTKRWRNLFKLNSRGCRDERPIHDEKVAKKNMRNPFLDEIRECYINDTTTQSDIE